MSFKSNYYNLASLALFLFGLALAGISIFLLSKAVNTISQAFTLTSVYYLVTSIFGLLAHRWSRCYWYKYHAFNLALLTATQLFIVFSLGFAWDEVIKYLEMVDGSDSVYVSDTVKFMYNSRPAWLTLMSIGCIVYAVNAYIALIFHRQVYKAHVIAEYKRLHGIKDDAVQHDEEGEDLKTNNKKAILTTDQSSPLLVNIE